MLFALVFREIFTKRNFYVFPGAPPPLKKHNIFHNIYTKYINIWNPNVITNHPAMIET